MKIGFVLDDGLDAPDGVQQYVLTLGTWLTKQGHEVHYLVGETHRTDIANVHSLGKNMPVRFNKNRLSIPIRVQMRNLRTLLKSEQFDVIHVQLPYSPLLAGKILTLLPKTTVVIGTFHILPFGRLQTVGARLLAILNSKTIKRFNHIIAVSPAAQDFAAANMHITSTVIPNAVNLDMFAHGKKLEQFNDGKQNVVFLGRLVARKGCQQLLQAVHLLAQNGRFENRRLIVAGDGPLGPTLVTFTKTHKLESYVEFVGHLSEAEKPNYLRSSDLTVLPSMSGESFGIVVVEAIAAGGGAVVGGNNPGYQYVLNNDHAALVDPLDTSAFAQKIDVLLSDPKLRHSLHAKQLQHCKTFDIHKVGPQIEKLYKTYLAPSS